MLEDEAYVAGYIDADGCIRVQRQKSQGPSQYLPQVKIASVVPASLDFIKARHRGSIRKYQPASTTGNARMAFEWSVQGRPSVLRLMQAIEPHVIIKKDHVRLMIEFITQGEKSHPPHPVSIQEIERRHRIFMQFKELNQRGIIV